MSPLRTTEGDDIWRLTRREATSEPSDEEVALALDDIDCKEQTDLVNRLLGIVQALDEITVEEQQLALQEDRTRLDEMVRLATDAVEKAGGFQ